MTATRKIIIPGFGVNEGPLSVAVRPSRVLVHDDLALHVGPRRFEVEPGGTIELADSADEAWA